MNISSHIAGIKISPAVMNASGCRCTYEDELRQLARSESGAIVTKSMTVEKRDGNPKPKYYCRNGISLNSNGIENLGYREYHKLIRKLKVETSKPIIASIAGFKEEEYYEIAETISKEADLLEINLSCPNIESTSMMCYDIGLSSRILRRAKSMSKAPIGVKLPAFLDIAQQRAIAEMIKQSKVDYVATINSLFGMIVDSEQEKTVIKPNSGRGGIGGAACKQVALAQVNIFHTLFKGKTPIIGAGGISTGRDVYEFILAGASAVQIGTAYQEEGPNIFSRVRKELEQLMNRNGTKNLSEKTGTLKPCDA